jgi:hypothetical protein
MTTPRPTSRATRSKKAGRPPQPAATSRRVRRRQRTADGARRKDAMLLQAEDTRVRWAGAKPKFHKR